MKITTALLLITFPLLSYADNKDDIEMKKYNATIAAYAKSITQTNYDIQQVGKFCSIVTTKDDVDFPSIGTFDCNRLAADAVLDHEFMQNVVELVSDQADGKLTKDEAISKLYIFIHLRITAGQVVDKKYGIPK